MAYEKLIHNKEVIVLPQYPYLAFFQTGLYTLGSQDVSKFAKGNFTGEVCAKALRDLNVKYVLVGHSERREHFNETLKDIKAKIQNVIDNEMVPILAVNQSYEDYQNDHELKNIENQLEAIPEFIKYIVVAYEPTWLIGTNREIDIANIQRVLIKIKEYLVERNINHSIIYGGGVNPENVEMLKSIPGNDGFIVSSSALDHDNLIRLYAMLKN